MECLEVSVPYILKVISHNPSSMKISLLSQDSSRKEKKEKKEITLYAHKFLNPLFLNYMVWKHFRWMGK